VEDIHKSMLKFPQKSMRKLVQQSVLSYGSIRMAVEILKFNPFHICVMHKLKDPDRRYCQ
jgi:hypothetical protein